MFLRDPRAGLQKDWLASACRWLDGRPCSPAGGNGGAQPGDRDEMAAPNLHQPEYERKRQGKGCPPRGDGVERAKRVGCLIARSGPVDQEIPRHGLNDACQWRAATRPKMPTKTRSARPLKPPSWAN